MPEDNKIHQWIGEAIRGGLGPIVKWWWAALVVVVTATVSITIAVWDMRHDIKSALDGANHANERAERLEVTVQNHDRFFYFLNKIDFFKTPKTPAQEDK